MCLCVIKVTLMGYLLKRDDYLEHNDMLQNEVVLVLSDLGWETSKLESGDPYYFMKEKGRLFRARIRRRQLTGRKLLEMQGGVSTVEFMGAFNSIVAELQLKHRKFDIAYIDNLHIRRKPESITKEDVAAVSDEFIAWATTVDLEPALERLRSQPISRPSPSAIYHFTALAMNGDVEKLTFYRDSFAKGDRLDAVLFIQQFHIERALAIAEERAQ